MSSAMGSTLSLRLQSTELRLTDVVTRLPFHFGSAILRSAPLATLRVVIKTDDGEEAEGFSSDLLIPKWFEKDPKKSASDDVIALLASIERACAAWKISASEPASVFDAWHAAYGDCMGAFNPTDSSALVRGFGVALVERAVMDAVCRASDTSFHAALRDDLFGFKPSTLHANLSSWSLADSLPETPASSIQLRHTIGMADALRVSDINADDRLRDGLPQALEEDIAAYGVRLFKVKVGAGIEEDCRRLLALAAFFEEKLNGQPTITLDGNERYADLSDLLTMLEATARDPLGARLVERIAFIEQPLARHATFDLDATAAMRDVSAIAPIIIDEADGHVDAFPRAVALGYRGVSIKNCKGVFRALLNRGLVETSEAELFQSGEDLTNLPAIALQQDLTTMCSLGVPHVERNGHHYFRGLDHLPEIECASALDRHADLYAAHIDGARLCIQAGNLQTNSLACLGFGYDHEVAFTDRTSLKDWVPPEG